MVPQDMEKMFNGALAPGQSFLFRCHQCGSCCRNREDILLNPYDLHRIAGELKMAPADVVAKYCITYIGESSRLPCVLLKPIGNEKVCPLLQNGKCVVHKNKPTVCALYPLGRGVILDEDKPDKAERIIYFKQNTGCGSSDETHSVEEWLKEFNLQESESWFLEWSHHISEICSRIIAIEPEANEETRDLLFRTIFIKLYLDYPNGIGAGMEFLEIFKNNAEKLVWILDKVMLGFGLEQPK